MVWHFHSACHGNNVAVRPSGSRAIRNPDTYDGCILFSDSTIQPGELVSLFFKRTTSRWTGMPRIGFTNQDPKQLDPKSLPPVYSPEFSHWSLSWAYTLYQSQGNIFVDYAFDDMGVVTVKQFGHPEKLLDTRGAVSCKKPVWVLVDLSGCHNYVMINDVHTCTHIPQEIISLGQDAHQMYVEALTRASGSVRSTQLMLVGQGRVGKTSLMKKLTNQRFDPLERSTRGVDVSQTVQVNATQSWHLNHTNDADLEQRKPDLNTSDESFAGDKESLLHVWDFAGLDLYKSINEVFLTHRAIFVLVFNLTHDLDEPAVVGADYGDVEVGRQHELTTWENMSHWMHTIHACVSTDIIKQSQTVVQRLPPIILVGTHRNDLREGQVERTFAEIRARLSGMPYQQLVVDRFFAVENSLQDSSDTEVVALRTAIGELSQSLPYMDEEIPLHWLQTDDIRRRLSPIMSNSAIMKISASSSDGMTAAEAMLMLKYYHDTGRIICMEKPPNSPMGDAAQDVIVMDPSWLVQVLHKIMTDQDLTEQTPTLLRSRARLKEEGLLEEGLTNHLWKDVRAELWKQNVLSSMDVKQDLLDIMSKFDLLCERRTLHKAMLRDDQMDTSEGQGTTQRTYFVPGAICHAAVPIRRGPIDPMSCNVFYIDFHHFLPESFFSRLVVRALVWAQAQEGVGLEPRIAHRYVSFPVDRDHTVEMEMSALRQAHIKVCVKRLAVVSTSSRTSGQLKKKQSAPSASITRKVKDFLAAATISIKSTSFKGLRCRFCVPCPCDPEGALHFLLLSDCLEEERIHCQQPPGVMIDTSGIQEMFIDDAPSRTLDPYVMSEKHLSAIASKLGPEWEKVAVDLGFTTSDMYRFKQDNFSTDGAIFSMLVKWSHREGLDAQRKVRILKKALMENGCTDVAETLLEL